LASPNTALHSPKDKFNAASIVMRCRRLAAQRRGSFLAAVRALPEESYSA